MVNMACDGACDHKTKRGGYGCFTGTEMIYGPVFNATNNIAEYTSLIRLLRHIRENGEDKVLINMDSELVVNQINGVYAVRHPNLIPLFREAYDTLQAMPGVKVAWVPRNKLRYTDIASKKGMTAQTEGRYPADMP